MTSSVLALTTGLHQTHPPVFIFRSSRPLRAAPVQHTARVPPVNNSYSVGMQTCDGEQSKLPDTTPSHRTPTAHRVPRRVPRRTAMHPKTMRQQNTQHIGNQQATSMRKQPGFQRPQTRAAMTTEYQEKFFPPCCYSAVAITTRQRDPYHPLKGTNADMSTFGSYYVTCKWVKNPTKAPQPPVQAQGQQRCSSAPHNRLRSPPNQTAPVAVDYTTVYRSDFQAWNANKRQPIKQHDCLKVNQGLVVPDERCGKKGSVKGADDPKFQEPQPVESITSYRCDFITHPVQARQCRDMAVSHPNKGLSLEPAVSFRPKETWGTHQQHFDGVSEMQEQFKTWSIETKFHGQGQAKESSTAADHNMFLSTTHRDYTAHKCQRIKPILPNLHTIEKKNMLFQDTTTMREDYKAWDTPHFPTGRKEEQGRPKKASGRLPKLAENFKINPEPFGHHSTWNKSMVCNSSCNATGKSRCPAENGAFSGTERITSGTGNPGGTGPHLWSEE